MTDSIVKYNINKQTNNHMRQTEDLRPSDKISDKYLLFAPSVWLHMLDIHFVDSRSLYWDILKWLHGPTSLLIN